MIFPRTNIDSEDKADKQCDKSDKCYFEWYEQAEKETCNAARKAAGLCYSK